MIIFTGDWHWGAALFGKERNGEIMRGIEQVVRAAKERGCRNVFITGDVMDSPRYRGPEALSSFAAMINYVYSEIPGLKLYLLKGNHDWDGLAALGVLRGGDFTVIDKPSVVEIDGASVLAVPYMRKLQLGGRSYLDVLKELEPEARGEERIIAAHAALEGSAPAGLEEACMPADALKECAAAYGFLGHIHKHCPLGGGWHYTGSLIRCSFGESEEKSGIYCYDRGDVEDVPIEARRLVNLKYLSVEEAKERMEGDIKAVLERDPGAALKINAPGLSPASEEIERTAAECEHALGAPEGGAVVKFDYSRLGAASAETRPDINPFTEDPAAPEENSGAPLFATMKERLSIENLWKEYCGAYPEIEDETREVASRIGGALLEGFSPQDVWGFIKSGNLGKIEEAARKRREEREAAAARAAEAPEAETEAGKEEAGAPSGKKPRAAKAKEAEAGKARKAKPEQKLLDLSFDEADGVLDLFGI